MLPHIGIRLCHLIAVLDAREARVGHILLVAAPRDALLVQQVSNARHVCGQRVGVVVVDAEIVAADGGDVVGLGRVRDGKVV